MYLTPSLIVIDICTICTGSCCSQCITQVTIGVRVNVVLLGRVADPPTA